MSNKERLELSERVKERIESIKPYNNLILRGKKIDKEVKNGC